MWLALLILVTGWWITIDGAISIAFRLGELDESDITTRQEIEFAARLVRGDTRANLGGCGVFLGNLTRVT